MDKSLRSNLLDCMTNIVGINAWRETLAENQRMEWNHPTTVLRRWRASVSTAAGQAQPGKVVKGANLQTAFNIISQENEKLKAEVEKLRAKVDRAEGGDLFTSHEPAWQIAQAIANELRAISDSKFDEIVYGLKEARKKRTEAKREAVKRKGKS
jgi:hypothetical protein